MIQAIKCDNTKNDYVGAIVNVHNSTLFSGEKW